MEETTINETDQINEADGTAFVEPETIDKGEVAFDDAAELVDVVSSDDDEDEKASSGASSFRSSYPWWVR